MSDRKAVACAALGLALAGCANVYQPPPAGPETASLALRFEGTPASRFAGVFQEPSECRVAQRIELDPGGAGADVAVRAGLVTVQLGTIRTPLPTVQTCQAILSFEAQAGSKYTLRQLDTPATCNFRLVRNMAGGEVDATNTLVKRARADMSLPGAPDRPWCSDRYPR